MSYQIKTNMMEILTEQTNPLHPVLMEAVSDVNKDASSAAPYVDRMTRSIQKANKSRPESIVQSKGSIDNFKHLKDLETNLSFLKSTISSNSTLKDLESIFNSLKRYKTEYVAGYDGKNQLVMVEYESVLYLLVTGVTYLMATCIDIGLNGADVKASARKSPGKSHGVIPETIKSMSKELNSPNHHAYLKDLIKIKRESSVMRESTPFEEGLLAGAAAGVVAAGGLVKDVASILGSIGSMTTKGYKFITSTWKTFKDSMFGILPLIRACVYLHYKKKADMIAALEEQAEFIRMNIDQLKANKKMDPDKKAVIIKKQEAYIKAYLKKAEKLRAELTETEKDASVAIKKDDDNKNPPDDTSDDTSSDDDWGV